MPNRFLRTALIAFSLAFTAGASASDPTYIPRPIADVSFNNLANDTQQTSNDGSKLDLVWWIPAQFWQRAMLESGTGGSREASEITALFSKFTIVAVLDGEMSTRGPGKFKDADELREETRLVDADGERIAPIPESKLDPQLRLLFRILKPMMSRTIGAMGENMQFFAFPAKDDKGRPLADPLSQGKLTVEVAERRFAYPLPLVSLLQPAVDPQTGDEFPGNYRFNPYTGAPLRSATKVK